MGREMIPSDRPQLGDDQRLERAPQSQPVCPVQGRRVSSIRQSSPPQNLMCLMISKMIFVDLGLTKHIRRNLDLWP